MKSTFDFNERPTGEMIFEIICLPLLFLLPYIVISQLVGGVSGAPNKALVYLFTILTTAILFAAFYFGGLALDDKPVALFSGIYLAETILAVCFFIIFQSQESFRLPQQTIFQTSVSFAVVVFFLQSAFAGGINWRRNYLTFPILLVLGYSLFSFCFSTSFMVSLKDFFVILSIATLFWLIINTYNEHQHFSMLAVLALTIGGLMSFIGVAQHMNLNEVYKLGRNIDAFSTLGNKNYVAEVMGMLIPFALASAVAVKGFAKKFLVWFAIESMLIVVLVSQTRGSWIGLAFGLIVLVMYGIDNFDTKKIVSLLATVAIFVVNAIVIMYLSQKQYIFYEGPTNYAERFFSVVRELNSVLGSSMKMWAAAGVATFCLAVFSFLILKTKAAKAASVAFIIFGVIATFMLGNIVKKLDAANPNKQAAIKLDLTKTEGAPTILDDSIASRRFIYGGSWQIVKHNPFGTGIGAFKTQYLSMLKTHLKEKGIKSIPGFFKDVNAKEAHNEYLHTWAEQGPIGLLLLLFFIVRLILYFYKVYYRTNDDFTKLLTLGAFAGLCAIGASAMLGFPFRIVPTAVVCCLLICIIVFADDRAEKAARKTDGIDIPIENDPRRWSFAKLDITGSLSLAGFAVIICVIVSTLSIRWQLANITLKEGEFYAKSRVFDQAKEAYGKSLRLDSANGEIYFSLGMLDQSLADQNPQEREKHLDNAIEFFLKSLKYYDLPMARLNLGAAYFQKGEIYFQQARNTNDKELFKSGDLFFEKASHEFLETISLYPNYPLPWFNLGLMSYEKSINSDIAGDRKKALAQLKDSENMLKKTLSIDSTLVQANFKLALIYERMGDRDKAIKQYEKTITLTPQPNDMPTYADSHYNLGILYAGLSQQYTVQSPAGPADPAKAAEYREKAFSMFSRTLEINPSHQKALNNRANIYYQMGDIDKAILDYEKALYVDPNYIEAKLNLALVYMTRGRFAEALRYAQEMLALGITGEKELKLLRIAGVSNMNLGNLSEANQQLSLAVDKFKNTEFTKSPDYSMALINLSEVRSRTGDRFSADAYLQNASQDQNNPLNNLIAMVKLGMSQAQKGNNSSAEKTFRAAIKQYRAQFYDVPELAQCILSLGDILANTKRAPEALKLALDYNAMPIKNQNIKSMLTYKIGWYYRATGNEAKANESFKTVLTKWPSSVAAQHIKKESPTLK